MATSVLKNPHETNLDEQEDDTSIIAGLSEQELLDLVVTSEITSWDGVFYHLGLPLPKSGEEKSAEPLGIIAKLLTVWIERGDSSRSQLLDKLDKLHERHLTSLIERRSSDWRMRELEFFFSEHEDIADLLAVLLRRKFEERRVLAKTKLSAYLVSHWAAIVSSNEPVETLAKRLLEGCFTEMDFSTVQETEAILLKAVKDVGFAEVPQRFELDEIVACFQKKEQLLLMLQSLTKPRLVDKYLSLPDMNYTGVHLEFIGVFYTWKQFALERMSRDEWKSTLQGALREAGVPASVSKRLVVEDDDEVTSWHVQTAARRLPVEKAEDLGLALGFQKEEVDILQTLTMCNYHTYSKLCLWNKRTQFSRHKLFLALCLSGYSTFATSNLYGMNPADVYVTKSFGRSGGEVNLEDEGIQLSIPMGALAENQRITFHLLEEGPLMPSVEEVSICPGFRVAPSGLSFHSRIKVTMDHSATILQQDRAGKEGIVVYVRQEEGPKEQWKVVRYDLSTSTDCPVEVVLTNDKVELYLTHFTSFWVRIKRAFIKNKRIACTPFLPKYMPANRKPVLRLYIHRISRGTVKMIQEEEKNSCPVYQQTTPHDQFLVIPNGQDLTVTCDDEGRIVSKTVSSENLLTLRRQARNRLEFELDFSSLKHGDKNVKVDLFQDVEKNRKEMIIPTTFKGILSKEHRRFMDQDVTSSNTVSPIPNLRGMGKRSFDDMLKMVAKKVVQNIAIDDLGVALGFDVEDIHRYIAMNHKYQNITNDGTLQMLRDWRKRQTESTECLALKRALEESSNIRLADGLFGKGMETDDGQEAEEPSGLEREPRQSREEPCVSEGAISAELDALHLESTQDMALSGACASAPLDKVTNEQLVDIAVAIPGESFVTFFVHLGFDMDYPYKVLERWSRSYRSASEELLSEWARNHQYDKDLLREALRKSKLKFLAIQYLPS